MELQLGQKALGEGISEIEKLLMEISHSPITGVTRSRLKAQLDKYCDLQGKVRIFVYLGLPSALPCHASLSSHRRVPQLSQAMSRSALVLVEEGGVDQSTASRSARRSREVKRDFAGMLGGSYLLG